MSRDRTARQRIRNYLATQGPIEHDKGKATAALMEAIAYQGNAAAFIQLVAAMDRDGEIERVTRGKRTYKISGVRQPTPSALPRIGGPERSSLDYDALARALLRETFRVLTAPAGSAAEEDVAALRAERDQLLADRTRLQERLDRVQREALGGDAAALVETGEAPASSVDDRVRTLLAELVGEQRRRADRTG